VSTSLHTLGWTDPTTLLPENGCQIFYVGWLPVIPADDDAHEIRYREKLDRRILRDDDETVFALVVAFMEIRDRWH
jgi:hypothetical protein